MEWVIMSDMANNFLTTAKVAKMYGVRVSTVQRWITERRIEAVRGKNGRWQISPDELSRFLSVKRIRS
tara:strand:- start:3616 stop:3819 length:204 start_codon:yes stop_codon:yes gene_type:complete